MQVDSRIMYLRTEPPLRKGLYNKIVMQFEHKTVSFLTQAFLQTLIIEIHIYFHSYLFAKKETNPLKWSLCWVCPKQHANTNDKSNNKKVTVKYHYRHILQNQEIFERKMRKDGNSIYIEV